MCSRASAWSIASTGVAPTPALIRTTGRVPSRRTKLAARRGGVDAVADLHVLVQPAAGGAVALDADPVALLAGEVRQRVAARQRRRAAVGPHAHGQVLARRRVAASRRVVVGTSRNEVTVALSGRTSATRSGRKPGHAGGAARRLRLGEQLAEAALPALAERRHAQRPLQHRARLAGEVEQRVDVGDRQPLRPVGDLGDRVAGLHRPLLEDAQVEPRAVVGDEQRRHRRLVHPDADAVARHARLGDLEQRPADAVAVADADLVVGEALDGEVLAELAEG